MKKLFIAMCCMLGLTFILCGSVGVVNDERIYATVASVETTETVVVEENVEEEFDWSIWFKEEVLPILIAVGSAVSVICAILLAALKTIRSGIELFKKSKQNFDTATNGVVTSQKQISEMKSYNEEQAKTMLERLDSIEIKIGQIMTILKIAFCNNGELVKNGYANEIMKVGEENGTQEIKETNNTDANA